MTQTEMFICGEDVVWMLLQATGIAVLYFAVRKFMVDYRLSLSRPEGGPSAKQTVSLCELVMTGLFVSSTELLIAFEPSRGSRYQ